MKKLLKTFALISLASAAFFSCSKYDDSDLWNRVNDHESRISALESLCRQMNSDIASLQSIANALNGKDLVTGCTPVEQGGKVIGYTITFSKGSPITVYNGTDGKDGSAPAIGVKEDGGTYYWTVDGQWMKDGSGNRIPCTGKAGSAVTVTIGSDGNWYVDGKNTGVRAAAQDGKDGATPTVAISADGNWVINGTDTGVSAKGRSGMSSVVTIGENGDWYIDGKDTGVKAQGEAGQDGHTPTVTIGENGDWYIDGVDTGKTAKGSAGAAGATPQLKITDGFWYVSYDGGASWSKLGQATGSDGTDVASLFRSVTVSKDGKTVTFVLKDGTSFTVPVGTGA